ncbi:MAG: SLBB domain-containing protein [Alphaproteobacteria bacterium]|nr:SLBB domain-containing protein [Alphaproteobacteria bacterium]
MIALRLAALFIIAWGVLASPFARAETPDTIAPLSRIESFYAGRVPGNLGQFGYDLFGMPNKDFQKRLDSLSANASNLPSGAIQDSFVLGTGDELDVVFSGQRTDRERCRIDGQGFLLIKDFPPIPAAGRTMGQVRVSVEEVAQNIHNTRAYVSLSAVRQIGVLVAGHVGRPGKQTMTVFHTILDALMAAGGIQKTGSLRQIKLVREGRTRVIDIYDLLLSAEADIDLTLKDGDRIIVPAIGPTVAVTGEVNTPGIFEIRPAVVPQKGKMIESHESLSLTTLLKFGGRPLAPGNNRYLKLEVTADGEERVSEIHDPGAAVFGNGTILMVSKGQEKRTDTVELRGHTRRPGLYALAETPALSDLIPSEKALGPDIYPLIGTIKRWDPDHLTSMFMPFPLRRVLKGDFDRTLQDGDVVTLFSNEQIAELGEEENPDEEDIREVSFSPSGDDPDQAHKSFLRERFAYLRGGVRSPGAYPVAQETSLDEILAAAGGTVLDADTGNIEIISDLQGEGLQAEGRSGTRRIQVNFQETSPADIAIGPGDSVRVNRRQKKLERNTVLLMGEIQSPGRYDLVPGDKLSDLLGRAGGFTAQAYPAGALFSRESARRAEEMRFRAQAQEMKEAVAAALKDKDGQVGEGKIAEARALAAELEKAEGVGRLTVEADLAVLKLQPELDILLEPGDRIYIPKRSLTVRVSGEVLSSAYLQFRKNKDPLDYIREAGGFTFHADKERTFVLYPDGSAQPLRVSSWNHAATFIPPGSAIIVPRDPEPFDFIESAKDISQILSNLAITAIFVDDVRDDNN